MFIVKIKGYPEPIILKSTAGGTFLNELALEDWSISGKGRVRELFFENNNNQHTKIYIERFDPESRSFVFRINGKKVSGTIEPHSDLLLNKIGKAGSAGTNVKEVKAPMPGLIRKIAFQLGDTVEKGDTLFILEAMKMENLIKAPRAGKVAEICVEVNAAVEKNQILLRYAAE